MSQNVDIGPSSNVMTCRNLYFKQVPLALEFFTLTCIILFVNVHISAQEVTCGIYPGGPMYMYPVPNNAYTDLL